MKIKAIQVLKLTIFIFISIFIWETNGIAQVITDESSDKKSNPGLGTESFIKKFNFNNTFKIITDREIHVWQRYVQGFRKGHNFSFSSGKSEGKWHVKRFGSLEEGYYDSSGYFVNFRYAFHIPIYSSFGYFLGSSFGYLFEDKQDEQNFSAPSSLLFPNVEVGLVYNVSPGFRVFNSVAYGLERQDGFSNRSDDAEEEPDISVTLKSFDLSWGIDYFFDLAWALRLDYHTRYVEYEQPIVATENQYPVLANIEKKENWVGVSFLYHLL